MKFDITNIMKKTADTMIDNLPSIASKCAVAGVVASVLLMHKADNKANEVIDKQMPAIEKVKRTWKFYIPVATSTAGTIMLIISADKMWANKYIACLGAYGLTKKAYADYRSEIRERLGIETEKSVYENSTAGTINDIKEGQSIGVDERLLSRVGWGHTLFVESSTGQLLVGNRESIKAVFNKLNHRMNSSYGDPTLSLDELCIELGLRCVDGGDKRGWDANYTGLIEPKFSRVILVNNDPDLPATVIDYFQPALDNFGRDKF